MEKDTKRHAPLLLILSSPSGAGKSSLAREVMSRDPEIQFSVSATTRPPRPGEIEGQHYYFMSRAQFEEKIEKGEMLEYAEVFGNLYGTPLAPVEKSLADGRDIIFDVDWQGGDQIRECALKEHVVSVFVLPPSISELHQRLRTRAQDSDEVIERRMRQSRQEISHWKNYDYLLINRDINRACIEFEAIIRAERLKRKRWTMASQFVDKLNDEFEELWHERDLSTG